MGIYLHASHHYQRVNVALPDRKVLCKKCNDSNAPTFHYADIECQNKHLFKEIKDILMVSKYYKQFGTSLGRFYCWQMTLFCSCLSFNQQPIKK